MVGNDVLRHRTDKLALAFECFNNACHLLASSGNTEIIKHESPHARLAGLRVSRIPPENFSGTDNLLRIPINDALCRSKFLNRWYKPGKGDAILRVLDRNVRQGTATQAGTYSKLT